MAPARVWERRMSRVNIFCIFTSLESVDVMVLPSFMIVVWVGDVVTSFVKFMRP